MRDWYLPAGHAAHVALPPVLKVPFSQLVGLLLPAAQASPAGQGSQSEADAPPAIERKLPAGHNSFVLAPNSQ